MVVISLFLTRRVLLFVYHLRWLLLLSFKEQSLCLGQIVDPQMISPTVRFEEISQVELKNEKTRSHNAEEIQFEPENLYACGSYGQEGVYAPFAKNIVTSVFPEIKHGENPISLTNRSDVLKNNPTKNDLLIKYWKSSCALHPDVFPGVTLEFSGEMVFYDTTLGKRTYYIGPNDDSPKSLSVSFMATKFNLLTPSEQERIIDHSMKPKSLKKRFLVYAASNCRAHREIAFDALSQIGDVYQGGECWGLKKERSSVKLSTLRFDRDKGSNNNALMYRNYRFALVMESTISERYISEKILNAFLSGTVPIWYGAPEIFDIFNRQAFVYYNVSDPEPALNYIAYLESNTTAYDEVQGQPILAHGVETVAKYFSFSDALGGGQLKKRIKDMLSNDVLY